MALTTCAKHGKWTISLLQQLDYEVNSLALFTDSLGAKSIAENPVHHGQTKHIDIRHHFIQDAISEGTFSISPVVTKDNVADLLTKSLSRDQHEILSQKIGVLASSGVGECCEKNIT